MKKAKVIAPKKKNTFDGLPLFYYMAIGANMMHIVPPSQFIIVAKGTILLGTISGTYNQVTGPTVRPKINI